MAKILIVEDERPISRLIALSLSGAGHECQTAFDGEQAEEMIDSFTPDLILLDVMLPKIDGFELLTYIKPLEIPTIFLTAKDSTEDKVRGLRNGADDYITKPFEIVELLARVDALLRRIGKSVQQLQIDSVHIDLVSRKVTKDGQDVGLTNKEFELLSLLLLNKNIALSRNILYEKIWGDEEEGDSRTLDLHIARLRKKLGWQNKIKTMRRYGYRLEL